MRELSDHVLTTRVTSNAPRPRDTTRVTLCYCNNLDCSPRYGVGLETIKKYKIEAAKTELLVLIFLYFSAYLTGIAALLERLDDSSSQVSVKVVYGILLVFYTFVPVAGCAFVVLISHTGSIFSSDPPDDPAEYTKWLEEQSKNNPLITIIAPFEKKYCWCVMGLAMARMRDCLT